MSTPVPDKNGYTTISMPSSAGELNHDNISMGQRHANSYLRHKGNGAEKAIGAAMDIQIGFDGNVELANWYQTNSAQLNELDLDGFFAKVRERFLPTRWAAQWAAQIANQPQGKRSFKVWAEEAQFRNKGLTGLPEALSEPTLIDRLMVNMVPWLREALMDESTASTVIRDLALKLNNGSAKTEDNQTFAHWISLIDKVERNYITQSQTFQLMLNKRSAATAGIGKANNTTVPVAAAPAQYPVAAVPAPYSASGPPSYPPSNVNSRSRAPPNVWSAPHTTPYPQSTSSSPYPDKLTEPEKDLLSLLVGCFTCRAPWQSHPSALHLG
ncbi:hypothetical protein L218DRAFT_967133 [Marasmius fiardii PR-910]|nr:hypothetical protein L218DRAFT_967133 [Marasmius fiardii PR-910]